MCRVKNVNGKHWRQLLHLHRANKKKTIPPTFSALCTLSSFISRLPFAVLGFRSMDPFICIFTCHLLKIYLKFSLFNKHLHVAYRNFISNNFSFVQPMQKAMKTTKKDEMESLANFCIIFKRLCLIKIECLNKNIFSKKKQL